MTANGDGIAINMWWGGLDGFEPETLRFWAQAVRFADFVVDVGANTGAYSLAAAAVANVPVLALEPVPVIADQLRQNVVLNAFSQIEVLQAAAAATTGVGSLHVPHDGLTTEASLLEGFRPFHRTIEVALTTLDVLVEQHQLGGTGLVKIDTEATEDSVLRGASATMTELRPVFVVEVLRGRTEAAIEALCTHYRYVALWMGSSSLPERKVAGDASERLLNWVLAPAEKLDMVRGWVTDERI